MKRAFNPSTADAVYQYMIGKNTKNVESFEKVYSAFERHLSCKGCPNNTVRIMTKKRIHRIPNLYNKE